MTFKPALVIAALCLAFPIAMTATAQSPSNSHVQLVLDHLKRHNYALPAGEFLLLSVQPLGVVEETVVYELDQKKIAFLPGTHADGKVERQPLTPEKVKLIRDIMALDAVKSLPAGSGKVGLDGVAFVALFRSGNRLRMIGHWSPDAPGIELLEALRDRELRAKEQAERRPGAPAPPPR